MLDGGCVRGFRQGDQLGDCVVELGKFVRGWLGAKDRREELKTCSGDGISRSWRPLSDVGCEQMVNSFSRAFALEFRRFPA